MRLQALQPRVGSANLRTAALPPKVADPFYSSPQWIALRDRVRREAGGRCQVPGCTRRGAVVDHIVELKDGGAPLDRKNIWLTCHADHNRKTTAERAKRTARRPGGPLILGAFGAVCRRGAHAENFSAGPKPQLEYLPSANATKKWPVLAPGPEREQ